MSEITQIQHDNKTGRVLVYIDFRFCASIRQHIWDEMNLREGSEINCAELHQKEALFWEKYKKTDGVFSSRHLVNRTVRWLARHLPDLDIRIKNLKHCNSDTHNIVIDQFISLYLKKTNIEIATMIVFAAGTRRGSGYLVDLDILTYAKNQYKKDIFIVLYFKDPVERFIWLKPDNNKEYKCVEITKTNGKMANNFVSFNYKNQEIYLSKSFCKYIRDKIDSICSKALDDDFMDYD